MKQYSKATNTIRSSMFGLFFKLINILGAFIVRTMLIHILGIEFVGLDGVFSSILKLLNMAEIGFSSAIVFKLYKPIAEEDDKTVCALLLYYRKIYRIVGTIVLVLGIIVLPFIPHLISGKIPSSISIYALYLIYLSNTALSYWLFAYKTAILTAYQRNDLISKVYSFVYLVRYGLQVTFLLLFKNYYVFAIFIPITTILSNVGISIIVDKFFPQYQCMGEIGIEDKKEIKSKVTALLYNKLGVAIITGSDNLVISSVLGLTILGIYDSYYYIFSMLYSIFDIFHSSLTGGIGNSIVTESSENNFKIYKKLCFANMWVTGWVSITLMCLYHPFMIIWIGSKKTFDEMFSVLMAIYFGLYMFRFISLIFKNALGMWREDRYRALIESIVNLVMNLIFVHIIGIYGITLSTILAMVLISVPWENYVLFRGYFNKSLSKYFYTSFISMLILSIIGLVTYIIVGLIPINNILGLLSKLSICIVIPNIILCIIYRNNKYYIYWKKTINNMIRRRRGNG